MNENQKLREAHDYKQANGSMNCMQCAAAYMLGFPVEMVPDFALHEDATLAWDAFHAFFKTNGYAALMLPSTHAPESDYLASGSTSRGTKHIVVMNDGELVFDPHPSNAGLSKIDCIYVIARQALALPTADHLPDAGEMVVDHFPDATKMIETAAPVGERLTLSAEDVHAAFVKHFPKTRISQAWIGFAAEIAEAIAARAALIAGDAGWQPIETAPKDGSDCWLLVDGDMRRGFWVEIEFEEHRDMDGRYIDQTDADAYWMDLDSGDSLEPTMFYPITKPLPPSLVDIDAAMRKDNT